MTEPKQYTRDDIIYRFIQGKWPNLNNTPERMNIQIYSRRMAEPKQYTRDDIIYRFIQGEWPNLNNMPEMI